MADKIEIDQGIGVRYNLSSITFRRMLNDHIRFMHRYTTKFENVYLCNILINFLHYMYDTDFDGFAADVLKCLKTDNKTEVDKNGKGRLSVTKQLAGRMQALVDRIQKIKKIEVAFFEKSKVISYIFDRFAAMSFHEREKIYFYDIYYELNDYINKSQMIRLRYYPKENYGNSEPKIYEVKPYDILLDDNSFSYYLIGYAKENGKSDYMICSFKLSRIISCEYLPDTSFIGKKEKYSLEKVIAKYGPAYTQDSENQNEIVVRLSQKGYELFLTSIARQRPIPIAEPKPDNEKTGFYKLKFDCSYSQIRNYFFSYGGEAEVLSPTELRERFINDYSKALNQYSL